MPVYCDATARSTLGASNRGSDSPSLPKETFRGSPVTTGGASRGFTTDLRRRRGRGDMPQHVQARRLPVGMARKPAQGYRRLGWWCGTGHCGGVVALGQCNAGVTEDGLGPLGGRHEEVREGNVEGNTPSGDGALGQASHDEPHVHRRRDTLAWWVLLTWGVNDDGEAGGRKFVHGQGG